MTGITVSDPSKSSAPAINTKLVDAIITGKRLTKIRMQQAFIAECTTAPKHNGMKSKLAARFKKFALAGAKLTHYGSNRWLIIAGLAGNIAETVLLPKIKTLEARVR